MAGSVSPRPCRISAIRIDEVGRGRVLGIERQRPPRLDIGRPLVAPLEGHPGEPHDRDRVVRVGREDLAVQALRLVEQRDGERSLRLEHQLDHVATAPARVAANGSQSAGSGSAGETRLPTATKAR